MSAADRLHPAVRYHIVNSLGWPKLRELQEHSIGPVLKGDHAMLLAPTAGGKTEAAILPTLSRMLTEDWKGLSVLYICPIKALLNNLEARLSHLAGLVGRRVQVWHGDVTAGDKKRAERDLPDILLTTPESLEGIMISGLRSHDRLLGSVRCVIVDELHAFAGDDRGWHLLALLERIRALVPAEPQRIGLSATVGDPKALLNWFAGHCDGTSTLVHIKGTPTPPALSIDYVGTIANAATVISQLHRGEKRLVFADSRSKVEDLAVALRARGVEVYVSHAALSADTRRQAEQAFSERQNCVIVATSTLELGLDVGDLDRVIQIDAPGSVASFLQRLGRTGRRAGGERNTLFLATHDSGLLESAALVALFQRGYVEPVIPPPAPFHILVQQIFATAFQHRQQITLTALRKQLERIPEFKRCIDERWNDMVEFLIDAGFLCRPEDGALLGPKAESRFRGQRFADLCVSFDVPRSFSVMHGNRHIGEVDPMSLSAEKDSPRVLALGGRSWRVTNIVWDRQTVYVEVAENAGRTQWIGQARHLSRAIAGAIKELLSGDDSNVAPILSKRAVERLGIIREEMEYTLSDAPISVGGGKWEIWTYQGGKTNALLAALIEARGGTCNSVDGYSVRCSAPSGLADDLRNCYDWLSSPEDANSVPDQLIKFQDQLPADVVRQVWLERLMRE